MKWLVFILSHSIFIAFCAAAMALQTEQLLQLRVDIYVNGFIFFATLCSYNFYWLMCRYIIRNAQYTPLTFLTKESEKMSLLFLSFAGLSFCFLKTQLNINYIYPAVLLTILYSLPLLPFKFLNFFRRAGVLKTLLLALTWSYVTAFLPVQKSFYLSPFQRARFQH